MPAHADSREDLMLKNVNMILLLCYLFLVYNNSICDSCNI